MKLFSTFGIEFTYLPNKIKCPDELDINSVERYVQSKISVIEGEIKYIYRKIFSKSPNYLDVHIDEPVLEISAPFFKNSEDLINFFIVMDKVVKKKGFISHRDKLASGGGHIHVGIPTHLKKEKLLLFIINLCRDINNRPYLNYIFNEYCDDSTSNNLLQESPNSNFFRQSLKCNTLSSIMEMYRKFDYHYNRWNLGRPYLNRRSILVSFRFFFEGYVRLHQQNPSIEFRIFDMVRNVTELKKHIIFLDRYLRYINDITMNEQLVIPFSPTVNESIHKKYRTSFKNVNKTKEEFADLLQKLGLRYSDYKIFFERNYLNRLALKYKLN